MRGQIDVELVDGEVVITFQSEAKGVLATRKIGSNDAFILGLLMDSDRPEEALNFETKGGLSLQIENAPYNRASLGIASGEGANLMALIEGNNISYLGRVLWKMARAGSYIGDVSPDVSPFTCRVSDFYLDTEHE